MGVAPKLIEHTWHLPLEKIVIARWLIEQGESIGASRMHYISNGIDLNVFKITKPIQDRPPRILTLYHTSKWKGVSDALVALRKVHERFPNVPITMFGVAKPEEAIPEWIDFVYNPPIEKLVALYNSHSIYLAASLTEGWALPPAEAMACGCTVVATDIGGFREYVVPDRTGLLSPVPDPESLYLHLANLIEDNDYRVELQTAAHQYIQRFSLEVMGANLESLLQEKLSRTNARNDKEDMHG